VTESRELAIHVVDLLEAFGPCEARGMFGGYGIFHQGLMFGLVANGNFYLKADDESRAGFEAAGCEAFTYVKQGRQCRLAYYLAPESFFEQQDDCLQWAHSAFAAALRNPARKRNRNP
jgi:DNA transformation protein